MFEFDFLLTCSDASAALWGFLDFSIAPNLLYYAYVPVILVSFFLGILILIKEKYSLRGCLLFGISILFSVLLTNEIIQWIAAPVTIVLFGWELVPLLRILVMVFTVYFTYVFILEKDLPFNYKLILSSFLLPVILLLSTKLNIDYFDLSNCEGVPGFLWVYINIVSVISIISVFVITLKTFSRKSFQKNRNIQNILVGGSATLFLCIFFLTSALGDITTIYDIALLGPIGMVIFLGTLTYLMVKFNAFNIKLIATQALIIIIAIMVGAQLFFVRSTINRFLTGATLIFTVTAGYQLIKSVRREIKQREEIQRLANKLEKANVRLTQIDKLKSEFVSIASHQLRSPITAISGYASLMRQGTYGEISAKLKVPVERIEQSARMMAESIDDYLNVSRIESGNMKYNSCDMNLIDEAEHICDDLRSEALKLGLILLFKKKTDSRGIIHADLGKVQQIIHNLLNNSIKYTPKGAITVYVHDDLKAKKIFVDIMDTGIGMSIETINTIFQKFERGDTASTVNVKGTGLGLYVALKMAEAMGGDISAHSEGEGKGSRFTIEMPLVM